MLYALLFRRINSLIAKAFGTTVQKIKDMNGMKGDALKIGQKLNVPKE